MSTFKGTPGPWNVDAGYPRDVVVGFELVATAYDHDNESWSSKSVANAALIAQAPVMLQIVTALLDTDAPHAARVDLAMILAREVHAALREGGAL